MNTSYLFNKTAKHFMKELTKIYILIVTTMIIMNTVRHIFMAQIHDKTLYSPGSEDNADGDVSGEVSGEVGDDADDSAAVVAHGNQVTSAVAMIGSGRVSGISKPRALTSPLSVATTGVVVKDTDTMTPNNNNNTTTTTIVNGTRSKVAALTEAANTTVVVPQSRAVVGTGAKTLTVLRLNPGSTNGGAEHSYAAATTTTTTAASSANRRVASTTETDDEGYSSRSSSLDSPAPGQPARGAEASDALGAEDQDTTEGSAGVQVGGNWVQGVRRSLWRK
jgi:hypothetical protein